MCSDALTDGTPIHRENATEYANRVYQDKRISKLPKRCSFPYLFYHFLDDRSINEMRLMNHLGLDDGLYKWLNNGLKKRSLDDVWSYDWWLNNIHLILRLVEIKKNPLK